MPLRTEVWQSLGPMTEAREGFRCVTLTSQSRTP